LVNSTVMTRASHSCSRTTGIPMEWDPVRAIEVRVLNGGVAEKCGGQLRGRRKQCRWWWWWWWWCQEQFVILRSRGYCCGCETRGAGFQRLENLKFLEISTNSKKGTVNSPLPP
jgi:hypothetical protein